MTRQHFKAIADSLRDQRPADHWDSNKRAQWDLDVNAMADVCRRFNTQFKRERFIDACGGLHGA
ncbi:MAG: hypothetical protein WBY44_27405 [Bryobacteraceae bacterium]